MLTADGIAVSGAYADGWVLFATAVSDDGLTLGGYGRQFGAHDYQAWIYDGHDRLPGDANSDGQVNLSDFGTLKANFDSGRSWSYGDFNGSGRIDLSDFGNLKDNFGQTSPNAVPEPATWLLAALAALWFARRAPECRG
jgi:hypothetical protein